MADSGWSGRQRQTREVCGLRPEKTPETLLRREVCGSVSQGSPDVGRLQKRQPCAIGGSKPRLAASLAAAPRP
jgi:hypothetical protein